MSAVMPTAPEEHREFYDDRWKNLNEGFGVIIARRISWICQILARRRLELERPLRILDFGCGQGRYSGLATQFGKVDAIDFSEAGIEVARRFFPGPSYRCMDAYDFTSDHPYDVILSIEVLEHMPDQKRYCEMIYSLLADQGRLLLTMPNRRAAKRYWADPKHANTAQPIEKWLTPQELRSLLESSGLQMGELTTRYVGYRRDPLGRLVNSYKLNRLTAKAPRRLWESCGSGLHLFACAAKP